MLLGGQFPSFRLLNEAPRKHKIGHASPAIFLITHRRVAEPSSIFCIECWGRLEFSHERGHYRPHFILYYMFSEDSGWIIVVTSGESCARKRKKANNDPN